MAGGRARFTGGFDWRAWLARLTALAFLLQGFGLFATHHAPSSLGRSGAAAQIAASAPNCPHEGPQGDGPGHHHDSGGGCPICQALGCALPGAPLPALLAQPDERLIGLLVPPAPRLPLRAPLRHTPPARGPPVFV
ncbi:MAG TPA: DUF2946 family protein [Rhodoblastus sp.]|nr:DUF2946 family protein [Rhodoblastus sp.]